MYEPNIMWNKKVFFPGACVVIWVWILKMVTMGTWSMGSNLVLRTMASKSIEFKKNLQPYHFVWNPKSNAIVKELQGCVCVWQIFVKFF
jgi:hypothetical protein